MITAAGYDALVLTYGDEPKVKRDYDGDFSIEIQNRIWVEDPRWLCFGGDPDQQLRAIGELQDALEQLAKKIRSKR